DRHGYHLDDPEDWMILGEHQRDDAGRYGNQHHYVIGQAGLVALVGRFDYAEDASSHIKLSFGERVIKCSDLKNKRDLRFAAKSCPNNISAARIYGSFSSSRWQSKYCAIEDLNISQ
ncbi:MAG: hypothetical protein J6S87_10435, partial [Bacteroidales bacterium]|nr:hypothetical protein [Bacteroidales bacterium]